MINSLKFSLNYPNRIKIKSLDKFSKLQIFKFRVKSSIIPHNNKKTKENISQSSESIKEKMMENSLQRVDPSINKSSNSNIYHAKTEIAFQMGKFGVINTDKSMTIKFSKIHKILISSVCILAGGGFITSLLYQSYTICCISGITAIIAAGLRSILNNNLSRLTLELNLIDDGKNVEIVTFTKRFIVELNVIKTPNAMQATALSRLNPDVANLNIPFVVDNGPHRGFYYIPPSKEIEQRKDLLYAILNKDAIVFCNKNK